MDEKTKKDLMEKEQSPFAQQMLEDTRALVSISRRKMTEYYPQWDKNDDTFRSIRARDKSDIAAYERNEPEKMVVPVSFAQIQTFVAFCFLLFYQKDRFFELTGFTAEDDRPAKVGEALLARDLTKNIFEAVLVQYLLDVARFGIGVIKCSWSVEKQMVRKEVSKTAPTFLGVKLGKDTVEETIAWATAYAGNRLTNI